MRYIVLEVLHMYKTFGETIASLRRAHGMRQQALAEAMAEAGMPVSNQAVSKWENDATLPNAQQFLTLCRVLDVDDIAGTIEADDEWLHSFYYFNEEIPSEEDFEKTMADYLTFEFNMITHGRGYLFEEKEVANG